MPTQSWGKANFYTGTFIYLFNYYHFIDFERFQWDWNWSAIRPWNGRRATFHSTTKQHTKNSLRSPQAGLVHVRPEHACLVGMHMVDSTPESWTSFTYSPSRLLMLFMFGSHEFLFFCGHMQCTPLLVLRSAFPVVVLFSSVFVFLCQWNDDQ